MSLTGVDLNLLLVLDTVLTERSVVRAAARLHVTPSAVSNALARLRIMLDDQLVVRKGRGIVPTPRAASLAPSLKQALKDLESVVQADAFDPLTSTRQFTLAIADAGQISNVPQLVKLIGKELPHARLRTVGIDTYISSGGLAGTEIDVALIALVDTVPGLHAMPVYTEKSVLTARQGNSAAGSKMSREQLARLKHVEIQVAPGRGHQELAQAYARLRIERNIAVIVPNFIAAAAIVAETDLVATLPASLVDLMGARLGLHRIAGPAPTIATQIKLVWHERTNDDPAMGAFREIVIKAVSKARRQVAR
jgi:DNA-binding transcriptional LysR family regulator